MSTKREREKHLELFDSGFQLPDIHRRHESVGRGLARKAHEEDSIELTIDSERKNSAERGGA